MSRSVTAELELPAGKYDVLMKIEAKKNSYKLPVEDVVRNNAKERRDKLLRIGLSYDLALAKGQIPPEEVKKEKTETEEREKAKLRKEVRERLTKEKKKKYV